MSVNDQPPSVDVTTCQRANQPSSDLQTLDSRLKSLSKDVLPGHPYLLTLPTQSPYRLVRRSASNWAIGHDRPFKPEEQELQYMTFLTHHNTDSLLKAVGDWSDEKGNMMTDRSTAPTKNELPKETVAKKKISLNDYKNQKNRGTSPNLHDQKDREARKPATREEPQQKTKHGVKKSDKTEPSHPPPKLQSHLSLDKGPKKRPSTSELDFGHPSTNRNQDMHSSKKRRLSQERDLRQEPTPNNSNSPRLPVLLSPTLPPTGPGPKLPRLLSPTLPPDIEKELAKLGDRSPTRQSPKGDALPSRQKREEAAQTRTPSSINSSTNSSLPGSRLAVSSKDANPELLVRLRYGKGNKRRVEALLKFTGKKKPNRPDSPPSNDTDHDDSKSAGLKRGELASSRASEPSERLKAKSNTHEEGLSSSINGRSKEAKGSSEKPHSQVPHPPRSHQPVNDKAKPVSLTPVKDPKASISRRNDLGEGEGRTPVNPANKRPPGDQGVKGSPSQPDGRSRNDQRRVWRDEFQKFSNIGRELKHAAVRYNAKTDSSTSDEKLAAVTAIEAIMCFILAFVADDHCKLITRQVGDSSTWQSILAYWRVVRKNSVSYPALHGLCLFLGAVSYEAIHSLDLERLAVSPLPGEHTPVPTPGSDGNAVPSDENRKNRKEFLELKNRLPECWKESQKLWLEGSRCLSEDVLSREFPTTWTSRSHNHGDRGKATLKPGDYAGDYFLPLGGATPPIEVVRFGWSLLQEWCAQEKVEWSARLGL
ncbi:hypothetical protein N7478_007990 [Penicillium angulare]|uniref:uncharacterized protein n=1 Tax=Penicillium angulare TaxID=116970 RepID=UPI002540511A|nr:uncharacterized protein N7478_007990 [Penicillium angulare]KAJ5272865.1 hypothetical protein N7478_007990 [Penicillium angulare]